MAEFFLNLATKTDHWANRRIAWYTQAEVPTTAEDSATGAENRYINHGKDLGIDPACIATECEVNKNNRSMAFERRDGVYDMGQQGGHESRWPGKVNIGLP